MRANAKLRYTTAVLACTGQIASALRLPTSWIPSPSRTHTLSRRASSSIVPAPIQIAPSQYWDGIDGQWSSFTVQVGQPAQDIRALIGTSVTSLLTVAAGGDLGGCPSFYGSNCEASRGGVFNVNRSLSWIPHSVYTTGVEENLYGQLPATTGFDTVTLDWQGSGGPTVEHNVVFNINPGTFWVGLFGISPHPTNFTTYGDPQPSFLNQLATNHSIPSESYGYTAGNQYRLNNLKTYGSLTFGGYDQNRFVPTNISFPFYEDISRDLSVAVHSVATDSGSPSNLLPGGQIQMFIDSAVSDIWLPTSVCAAFEQAFNLTWNSTFSKYLIDNDQHTALMQRNANVTFTIGGTAGGSTIDIVLPYGAFDLTTNYPSVYNPNTSYYFPLQRAANDTQYTLGRTFLQEAYIIADYDRGNFTVAPCLWDLQKINQAQIVPIRRSNETSIGGSDNGSSGISAGAIAGIVIAIVAVFALLGLALFFLRRRKNANKQRLAELEAKAASGSTDSANEGKPFIGSTGELSGGEIHELTAPHKPTAQELDSPYKTDPNKAGYSEMEGGEFYGPGKPVAAAEMEGHEYSQPSGKPGNAAEMEAAGPIFEMAGSDVHEMPAPVPGKDNKY